MKTVRKPRLLYIGMTVSIVAGVSYGVTLLTGNGAGVSACAQTTATREHAVVITNDVVTPKNTTGMLCDRLTITNTDHQTRLIAFGDHNAHVAYDGVTERLLKTGESVSITLDKKGSYHFHDHDQDEVIGYFTVK